MCCVHVEPKGRVCGRYFVNHRWSVMFSRHSAVPFATVQKLQLLDKSILRTSGILLLCGLLAGCTVARTAPYVTADPSDPEVPVRSLRYNPVMAGYTSQRPVGPKPWREQNERVTPKGGAQ
jgi:hypothetical protein